MTTQTNSYLTWTVFSERDQRRADEFLASFKETETVDELGFGVVRDYYADLFYPATTTVMTRARYYTFLVALFSMMEKDKTKSAELLRVLKKKENGLREILAVNESDSGAGVIGKEAKEKLLRYPSNIYWNGMKALGILHNNYHGWSLRDYARHLDEYYKRRFGSTKDDDGNPQIDLNARPHWETGDDVHDFCDHMFTGSSEWNNRLTFRLSKPESAYLSMRYSNSFPGSLISWLIEKGISPGDRYPWDLKGPPALHEDLEDAKMFSILAKGATLLYYVLLLREKKADTKPAYKVLGNWTETSEMNHLRSWKVKEWIVKARGNGAKILLRDEQFFSEWHQAVCQAGKASDLIQAEKVGNFIARREVAKKGGRARLKNPDYLNRWATPEFTKPIYDDSALLPYHLEYRATIGNRFVDDIIQGHS